MMLAFWGRKGALVEKKIELVELTFPLFSRSSPTCDSTLRVHQDIITFSPFSLALPLASFLRHS